MLRVKTFIAPSPIEGIGLFAAEFIQKGTLVWKFDVGLDQMVDLRYFEPPDELIRRYIIHYGFKSTEDEPIFVLCGDDARFMNHGRDCNLVDADFVTVACRDIEPNAEITCDYSTFDERYTQNGFVAGRK